MKNILVILLAVVGSLTAHAAEHEYLPLVEEGKSWHYKFWKDSIGKYDCSLTMKGDTLIEGKTYKKVFFIDKSFPEPIWPIAYMQEENKVVTTISNDSTYNYIKLNSGHCHDYRVFNFVNEVKYNFKDFSSPNYATYKDSYSSDTCYTMSMIEDRYDGQARNVAEWTLQDYNYQSSDLKYWVIEGVGIEGDNAHLLKTNMFVVGFGHGSPLGYLAYVTNAKGEVIYTGRTLRGIQSGVEDVTKTASVVSEEYYSVNGIKLTSPTSGIIIKVTHYSDGSTKATKFIKK